MRQPFYPKPGFKTFKSFAEEHVRDGRSLAGQEFGENDLSGANLAEGYMREIGLFKANLTRADLSRADPKHSNTTLPDEA
ncbi:MAG: pentapeptide repeat-containing protein [Caldilineaceae bacterium]